MTMVIIKHLIIMDLVSTWVLVLNLKIRENLSIIPEVRYHLIDIENYSGEFLNIMLDVKLSF